MRLDTANRSFAGLLGASLLASMFVFCGAVGCVLVVLVVRQVGTHGIDALTGHSLWPAVAFIVIVGAGVAVGTWSLVRQVGSSRRLTRRVDALALAPPDELREASRIFELLSP